MAKSKALATGVLDGDGVLVRDVAEANRLHNKALAGTPQPGNTLRLSLVEAAHCVAAGWLDVQGPRGPLALADLLGAGTAAGHRAEVDYLVYHDLRERGLVARHAPGPGHFDVWPRGTGQGAPAYQVVAGAEADPALGSDLVDSGRGGIIAGIVDADGGVTHYGLSLVSPAGSVQRKPLAHEVTGTVLADHVLVTDPAGAQACRAAFLGTAHGTGQLLSFLEAQALRLDGLLQVDPQAWDRATAGKAFERLLPAYLALREAGAVAKSGFRFGTDLRGYAGAPDDEHAPWLVQCAAWNEAIPWSALSRGVRLAHGVRKEFLMAITDGKSGRSDSPVTFVRLAWLRL